METHDIQRVLRARYGGVEASDILVQFARIELERPDALVWMQNGKFYEVYGDVARLLGRLLDLRVAEKPLMANQNGQPFQSFVHTICEALYCEANGYLPTADLHHRYEG